MFSPVNSNGAYVSSALQTRALADQERAISIPRRSTANATGMDPVQRHLQQQINREALERMQSILKLPDDFV